MRYALGLIEAIGLATAYEAADAAVKSANVTLLGFEPAKGDGMHTIKVAGDVGAVKAAVEAATAAAARGRGVFSATVIARPADSIEPLIENPSMITKKTGGGSGQEEKLEVEEIVEEVVEEPDGLIEETVVSVSIEARDE